MFTSIWRNLPAAGIVAMRQAGLNVYCRIEDENLFKLGEIVCQRLENQVAEKTKLLFEIIDK